MSQIPDSVIQEVLDKADIESVVGKYVTFTKRTGQNLFGLCPFHSEKTSSFSVSRQKNIFYCFGCHKGGNSIEFIKEIERLSFPEAVRFLAGQYGIEVPENSFSSGNDNLKKQKERVSELLLEAARYFYKAFSSEEGKTARDYAQKRGLLPNTVKAFGIGYAPDSWDKLYLHLKGLNYTEDEMKNSGLFTVSQKTGRLVDLFRGRMIFPIFDAFGKIIAFGGRSLGDDMPKYLNSPDSLVYKKQENLYALNFAKKERPNQLIIVEGYMDAIAMHQAGVTNTVASLGTAFTESQLRLSAKYAEEIVFFFDADNAGQNAALRAISMMMRYLKKLSGMKTRIRIACVPDAKDPDEYIREYGKEAFSAVVSSAKDVDAYLIDRAYDSCFIDGKLDLYKYEDTIIKFGSWIPDEVKRNRIATAASVYLKAKPEVIFDRINEERNKLEDEYSRQNDRENKRFEKESMLERNKFSSDEDENCSGDEIVEVDSEGKDESLGQVDDRSGVKQELQAKKVNDTVYEDEIKLLCYAMRLKESLADASVIELCDVLRPSDFLGDNIKKVIDFFLKHFDAKTGVSDALLMTELSKYTFNGLPAESAYLQIDSTINDNMTLPVLRGFYLVQLYSLRKNRLLIDRNRLAKALSQADSIETREIIAKKIIEINDGLACLKEREKLT